MDRYRGKVLGSVLSAQAHTYTDKVFLSFSDGRTVTFGELEEMSDRVAAGLLGIGVEKGDIVPVLISPCPEFFYTWFALAKLGAVIAPLSTVYKADQLKQVLNYLDSKSLVIGENFVNIIKPLKAELRRIQRVVVAQASNGSARSEEPLELGLPTTPFSELYSSRRTRPDVAIKSGDSQLLLLTSGTTGPSKGVVVSHAWAFAGSDPIAKALNLGKNDIYFIFMPFYHAHALLATVACLTNGASLVIRDRFHVSTFWEDSTRSNATVFPAFSVVGPILMKHAPTSSDRNHSISRCVTVGMPREQITAFESRFGIKTCEVYGATEHGTSIARSCDDRTIGSMGKATDPFEVRIVDNEDYEMPRGEVGEIVVRSAVPYQATSGYYKMPEMTVEMNRNFWQHTGDLGYEDHDGYFYFVGRKKEIIRRRGENISPSEIERIVNTCPGVRLSAAVPVASDLGEEDVKIVVTVEPGHTLSPLGLLGFCEERLPHNMVPRYIQFRDDLPMTGSGRIEKYKLKEVTPDTWDVEKEKYNRKR
jgi:carnitine-CoA ligase